MHTPHEQLEAMRGLAENWDGYGAAPPQAAVIDLAQEFASFLQAALRKANSDAATLHVSPTRVGGVLIEWEDSARQHELEIHPEDGISFLHLVKATGQITTRRFSPGGGGVVDPGLLDELRQVLAA